MATNKDTVAFILQKLGSTTRFVTRAMFGEYALYADGKVVALICDDQLYVKILDASRDLEAICEKGEPFPGAKLWYVVTEDQLSTIDGVVEILFQIANELPEKKPRKKK